MRIGENRNCLKKISVLEAFWQKMTVDVLESGYPGLSDVVYRFLLNSIEIATEIVNCSSQEGGDQNIRTPSRMDSDLAFSKPKTVFRNIFGHICMQSVRA